MLVHNKGKYIRHAAGVTLIPGVNDIPDAEWKKYSAHPIAKKLIDAGEVSAKKVDKLSAEEAIELAYDTYDLSVLQDMKENETRTTVLKAIDEQIKELQEGEAEQE